MEAALATGYAVEIFCAVDAPDRFADLLGLAEESGVPVSAVTSRAIRTLSDTVSPAGIVALCRSVVREPGREISDTAGVGTPHLVTIGQALGEPGNVGTLIRVSDALGADAVWLTGGAADPENTKAVRASAGSLFHLPVIRGIAEAELVARARAQGLQVAVATADGEVDVEHADSELARPTAWIFGNEAHGVPPTLVEAADLRVRIPIRGRAESLNIVTAASICLHTSARLQGAAA